MSSLRSPTSRPISALPIPLTPLVGRDRESARAASLLADPAVRLLTLTGSGGVGKTRLALRVAADASDDVADGVVFVNLATVLDPAQVLPAIAGALDLRVSGNRPLAERIGDALRDAHLLLVLDNFEQILAAGPQVVMLLATCPGLKALVTSRAALHVGGEHELSILPLAVPPPSDEVSLDKLERTEAVALFSARARAVRPEFRLTAENAPAVAEVCRQLDGLPLAIELAAARLKVLSPQALASRLTDRLTLLSGGPRDAPERLRTMRAAIAWSYNLLTSAEQTLFRRLSVFAGSIPLDFVERADEGGEGGAGFQPQGVKQSVSPSPPSPPSEATPPSPPSSLDALASLVDNSLLRRLDELEPEPRYRMLETIREFGLEQLREQGEEANARADHTAWFLARAEAAAAAFIGPEQPLWLHRLELDHDNLRAALAWSIDHGDPTLALRLGAALWRFWTTRGYSAEGARWLTAALAKTDDALTPSRVAALGAAAKLAEDAGDPGAEGLHRSALAAATAIGDKSAMAQALDGLGNFAQDLGDYARAVALHTEALSVAREAGDNVGIAAALNNLGATAYYQGDFARASEFWSESLPLWRALGDARRISMLLNNLGAVAFDRGDIDGATSLQDEALVLRRALGDKLGIAFSLLNLGELALGGGEVPRASAMYEEAHGLLREIGDERHTAVALAQLGKVAFTMGAAGRAAALLGESLPPLERAGDRYWLAEFIEALAAVAASAERYTPAVRLLGAAHTLRSETGASRRPIDEPAHARALAAGRAALDAPSFDAAWNAGLALPLPDAVAEGTRLAARLAAAVPADGPPASAPIPIPIPQPLAGGELTAREREVLRLVAEGHSSREVADALFISPRTASTHVTNILTKLNVNSRAAATAYALRHGII